MSAAHPVSHEQLVDYWTGDLDVEGEAGVEAHVLGCGACASRSAGVYAVVQALRSSVPPVINRAKIAKLEQQGVRIRRNPVAPGERKRSPFPKDVDILLHELGGLDLSDVARIDLELQTEDGEVLWHFDAVPFDPDEGRVFVACQRHFSGSPPNLVAVIHAHDAGRRAPVAQYTLLHEWEF